MRRRSADLDTASLDVCFALLPDLKQRHDRCLNNGMKLSRARLSRERDGTYTVRVVWRSRKAGNLFSISHETRGLVLT